MAEHSTIEWTDATWNPVTGCSVVSPGCKHCYAMRLAGTRLARHPSRAGLTQDTKAGPVWTGEVRLNEAWLDQPLRWRRPRRIFVCAHGDLFHDVVPDTWIDRIFAVMALAPQHTFQILTKRSARMRGYMTARASAGPDQYAFRVCRDDMRATYRCAPHQRYDWPLPNAWLGVSVEDQANADARIPDLLATPAALRFVSAEPLLGPIDLMRLIDWPDCTTITDALQGCIGHSLGPDGEGHMEWDGAEPCPKLNWVIVGGESGPGARPMHPDWPRALRDQCAAAGVPYFFKQWGAFKPSISGAPLQPDGRIAGRERSLADLNADSSIAWMLHVGKHAAGRMLDGVAHDGMPRVARRES